MRANLAKMISKNAIVNHVHGAPSGLELGKKQSRGKDFVVLFGVGRVWGRHITSRSRNFYKNFGTGTMSYEPI